MGSRSDGRRRRRRSSEREGLMQTIIIPRGTVNSQEVTVIEVPKRFRKTAVVVARRKNGASTLSGTTQDPYFVQTNQGPNAQNLPPPPNNFQQQYQPPYVATIAPNPAPVPQQQLAIPVYTVPGQDGYQWANQQQPMMAQVQPFQQFPGASTYQAVNPSLLTREQFEKMSVNQSLEEFHKARRGFLARAQDVIGPGAGARGSGNSLDLEFNSSDSLLDSYPCRTCRRAYQNSCLSYTYGRRK